MKLAIVLLLLLIPSAMPQSVDCSKESQDAVLNLGFVYGMAVMEFMTAYNAHNEHDELSACASLEAMDTKKDSAKQYHLVDDSSIDALGQLVHVRKMCIDLENHGHRR